MSPLLAPFHPAAECEPRGPGLRRPGPWPRRGRSRRHSPRPRQQAEQRRAHQLHRPKTKPVAAVAARPAGRRQPRRLGEEHPVPADSPVAPMPSSASRMTAPTARTARRAAAPAPRPRPPSRARSAVAAPTGRPPGPRPRAPPPRRPGPAPPETGLGQRGAEQLHLEHHEEGGEAELGNAVERRHEGQPPQHRDWRNMPSCPPCSPRRRRSCRSARRGSRARIQRRAQRLQQHAMPSRNSATDCTPARSRNRGDRRRCRGDEHGPRRDPALLAAEDPRPPLRRRAAREQMAAGRRHRPHAPARRAPPRRRAPPGAPAPPPPPPRAQAQAPCSTRLPPKRWISAPASGPEPAPRHSTMPYDPGQCPQEMPASALWPGPGRERRGYNRPCPRDACPAGRTSRSRRRESQPCRRAMLRRHHMPGNPPA